MNQNPAANITRDGCIRAPLIAWLKSQHADDDSSELLEEFKMPRPSARIDLAVVNGEIAGFEIKSDADTLKRLGSQERAFSLLFDRVSIVTTRKHLVSAQARIPDWWGIILFTENQKFRVARKAKRNRQAEVRSLLFALSRAEIAEVSKLAGFAVAQFASKATMVELAATSLDARSIRDHARTVLRKRARVRAHSSAPAHVESADGYAY